MIPIRSEKIGRNELCPCGSKKKYKVCHGGIHRHSLPAPIPGQVDARLRTLTQNAVCLAPATLHCDCKGKVISSHTVSRSGSLGEIASDKHVYSYKMGIQRIHALEGKIEPRLVGWKDASTFPGFCAYHDKYLFAPLEDQPFVGNQHQCFLLSFRSIAWEWYAKRRSSHQSQFRSALTATRKPELRSIMAHFNHMNELGFKDINEHKKMHDAVLENKRWSDCHGLLVEFDQVFPIQCSAACAPTEDIDGNQIQVLDLSPRTLEMATIASFAANGKSYFLLSWLDGSSTAALQLAKSILEISEYDLPSVIASLLLMTSENCHISPAWYDALHSRERNWINGLMHPFAMDQVSPAKAAKIYHLNDVGVTSSRMF